MTGEGFFSFIETGTRALLVTFALVAGYIILRRMARQMRKGVDIATRQSIEGLDMHWGEEGRLYVGLELTGTQGKITIHFEGDPNTEAAASHILEPETLQVNEDFDVPAYAHSIVIATDSERIYRRLPVRL
jgi:hypothetical protein